MAESGATLLERVAAIVGHAHVLSAPGDVEPYLVDWRGRYRGTALAVVRPGTASEVSAVVRACAAAGVAVVPQGGNTGMCGGATPRVDAGEVVLSLTRMQRVRSVDVANATITVEAGATLAAVQDAAAAAGLYFPLALASQGSATIGGNVSTNAGGTAVLRYGNARELTLGIEAVLADGEIWDGLRHLRKDNTGYDLKQLFIGAEGTLGIVTAVVMKLFPAPRASATAMAGVATPRQAVGLLERSKRALGDRLTGFELISAFALALSRKHHPGSPVLLPGCSWYVLLQVDDSVADSPLQSALENLLAAAVDSDDIDDAVVAQSVAQSRQMWAWRENISEAQRREGPNVKHD
ncbi:MAG: FAD-binding oxidoreductase, partial [Casimicrobiaceae bacterium]